jgi:hypothetical protein
MNRIDILKALISRSISPEEVRSALDDAQDFLGTLNSLEAIDGVKITVDVNYNAPKEVKEVLSRLAQHNKSVTAPALMTFVRLREAKERNNSNGWPSNIIPLIKAFREEFNEGLANAKWAIETLYKTEQHILR